MVTITQPLDTELNKTSFSDEIVAAHLFSKHFKSSLSTLRCGIVVFVGINVLVGKLVRKNKRTGWNKPYWWE